MDSRPPQRRARGRGRPLLAVPTACAPASTAILVYDHFRPVNLLAIVLSTAVLLLVGVDWG